MSAENGANTQVARQPDRTPLTRRDPVALAKHFAASGFFADTLSMSRAVVKIAAGEELGIGPMAAMQGVTIIEGKLGMTSNLMATLVQRHPDYRYDVVETTNERCALEFYERTDDSERRLGTSEFTVEDAERAGLVKPKSNWEKWPKAMCFARALSQGVRTYCPSVTSGTPAYVAEELGADVDEAGEVVSVPNLDQPAAAGEATDLEPNPIIDRLDDGVVDGLVTGIEFLGLDRDAVNLTLGAIGLPALDAAFEDLRDALAVIKPEEADKLSDELKRMATRDGEGAADVA